MIERLGEGVVEAAGGVEFGEREAPGLLTGFVEDLAPALHAFERGLFESFVGAEGVDWGDAGDAEFGGLLEDPLEVVVLDESGEEMKDGRRGDGLDGIEEIKVDGVFGEVDDFGKPDGSEVGDFVALAAVGAEDFAEVLGGVAAQGCLAAANLLHIEHTTSHFLPEYPFVRLRRQ